MRNLSIFFVFCCLIWGCKQSSVETQDMITKIEGTYKINTILTDGKDLSQANATLVIGRFDNALDKATFTVTYTSDNGKVIINQVFTSIKTTEEGYVLFYDPIHYPNSKFATWNKNVINCIPLTGQGPGVAFYAER